MLTVIGLIIAILPRKGKEEKKEKKETIYSAVKIAFS